MINEFQYKGFTPNNYIVTEAECTLERIEELTPVHSTIAAMLEYDGKHYSCSIDVFVKQGSFYASSNDTNAFKALHRAEEIITEKLSTQKQTRFYSRPSLLFKRSGTLKTA